MATEGSTSTVAPVLRKEGEYPFTVKLIHADGTVLAEDRDTAAVEAMRGKPPPKAMQFDSVTTWNGGVGQGGRGRRERRRTDRLG